MLLKVWAWTIITFILFSPEKNNGLIKKCLVLLEALERMLLVKASSCVEKSVQFTTNDASQ